MGCPVLEIFSNVLLWSRDLTPTDHLWECWLSRECWLSQVFSSNIKGTKFPQTPQNLEVSLPRWVTTFMSKGSNCDRRRIWHGLTHQASINDDCLVSKLWKSRFLQAGDINLSAVQFGWFSCRYVYKPCIITYEEGTLFKQVEWFPIKSKHTISECRLKLNCPRFVPRGNSLDCSMLLVFHHWPSSTPAF